MLVSLACNTTFIRALFFGTRGAYPWVVSFPDSILASLEPLSRSPPAWNASLKLHSDPKSQPTYLTNLSLTFSAHTESILSTHGSNRSAAMNNTTRPSKRRQITLTYRSHPTPPLVFQHLDSPLPGAQDEDANVPGIILTLSTNLRRSRSP